MDMSNEELIIEYKESLNEGYILKLIKRFEYVLKKLQCEISDEIMMTIYNDFDNIIYRSVINYDYDENYEFELYLKHELNRIVLLYGDYESRIDTLF